MIIDISSAISKLTLLQKQMGVEETPEIDWGAFSGDGIDVSIKEIASNPEGLLTYQGELCILYIRNQTSVGATTSNAKYHLTKCATIRSMRSQGRGDRYVVTNRADGLFSVQPMNSYGDEVGRPRTVKMRVCKHCLGQLNWDDYNRKRTAERNTIYNDFSIQSYLAVYTDRRRQSSWKEPPPEAPPKSKPTAPQPSSVPNWAYGVADEDFRAVLSYIQRRRFIAESDLITMLGGAKTGARRARRFARKFQRLTENVPFSVKVSFQGGQKVYQRSP